MRRSCRALGLPGRWLTAAVLMLAATSIGPITRFALAGDPQVPTTGAFEIIKRFDFDERPLGNFEPTPMYWTRLAGGGFPAYSAGQLDDETGHEAPPSFRLQLQGGNICYEYRQLDLPVMAGADYLVRGYVRAVGLRHARALLHVFLVDQHGQRVANSDGISRLVVSLAPDEASEPWQGFEVTLTGDFPDAHALQLELWVVQPQTWQPPHASQPDPIIHQDVRATLWFDDLTIYRLPRVRLRLSEPGSIVRAGASAALRLDVYHPSSDALATELTILDAGGRERQRERRALRAEAGAPLEVPLPALEPGLYEARLQLCSDAAALVYRSVRFAVLPELPPPPPPSADLGVDLGGWQPGDSDGVLALTRELRCGAAKIGVPMVGQLDTDSKLAYFDELRELARRLLENRVDVTGVLLTPTAAAGRPDAQTTRQVLTSDPECERRFAPLATQLGGSLARWQLGHERSELATGGSWSPSALTELHAKLERLVATPELVVPYSVFDAGLRRDEEPLSGAHVVSVWVPANLPARAFPWQLGFLTPAASGAETGHPAAPSRAETGYWLALDAPPRESEVGQHQADYARRIILAKTLSPDRVYLRAPFEPSTSGGELTWCPTDDFAMLRTLFHYLAGKRAVAAMPLTEEDAVAIVFSGGGATCLALWTWRDQPLNEPIELYLGPSPVAIDLDGRRTPLRLIGRKAQVPLGPSPIILDDVDAPLTLLQTSFHVEPRFVQVHEPEPRPVLRLRNYYATDLTGVLEFTLPAGWRQTPRSIPFRLAAGETLEHALQLEIPPRESAGARPVGVRVVLNAPVAEVLQFTVPITVGLRDIGVELKRWWDGPDLLVEQALTNLTSAAVSFTAYCQAPGRPQIQAAFLTVAPGETRVRAYRYVAAADLAGTVLRVGIREIQGRRTLDQLVEVAGRPENNGTSQP